MNQFYFIFQSLCSFIIDLSEPTQKKTAVETESNKVGLE